MTIHQVYEKYSTPKNLQEHMLRVSALSKIICDNWSGEKFDKDAVIKACVLHDIGKPVAFDLSESNLTKYGIPIQEADKLKKLKEFIKTNYSADENTASVEIYKDVGSNKTVIEILEDMNWRHIQNLIKTGQIEKFISVYCDMRIGPNGILNIVARIRNLQGRYRSDKYDYVDLEKNAIVLEKKLQEFVLIDLNSITDNQLNFLFPKLLDLEI